MAYTYVSDGEGIDVASQSGAASLSTSGTLTVQVGDLIQVLFRSRDSSTHSSVTDSLGNTYAQLGEVTDSGTSGRKYSLWESIADSAGSATVTVNPAAADDRLAIAVRHWRGVGASEVDGVDNAIYLDTDPIAASASGANSTQPALLTAVSISMTDAEPAAAVSGDMVDRGTAWNSAVGMRVQWADRPVDDIAIQSATFTAQASARHVTFVSVNPEVSVGTSGPRRMLLLGVG